MPEVEFYWTRADERFAIVAEPQHINGVEYSAYVTGNSTNDWRGVFAANGYNWGRAVTGATLPDVVARVNELFNQAVELNRRAEDAGASADAVRQAAIDDFFAVQFLKREGMEDGE